jgi:acylphosphatase
VGFRFFAEAAGQRESLQGWVRNLPDGRVEIVSEGDAEALERFERVIRQGPPGGRVDSVEVDSTSLKTRETGFNIR